MLRCVTIHHPSHTPVCIVHCVIIVIITVLVSPPETKLIPRMFFCKNPHLFPHWNLIEWQGDYVYTFIKLYYSSSCCSSNGTVISGWEWIDFTSSSFWATVLQIGEQVRDKCTKRAKPFHRKNIEETREDQVIRPISWVKNMCVFEQPDNKSSWW